MTYIKLFYSKTLFKYRYRVVFVFLAFILSALLTILTPLVNRALIDLGVVAHDSRFFFQMLFLSIGLSVIIQGLNFIEFRIMNNIHNEILHNLNTRAYEHMMRLPVEYFKKNSATEIMNEVSFDIGRIASLTDRSFVLAFVQIFYLIGGVVGLSIVSVKLLVIVLAFIPLKVLIVRYFSKRRETIFSEFMMMLSRCSDQYSETINGIEIVKLWNLFDLRAKLFSNTQNVTIDKTKKIAYIEKHTEILSSIMNSALVALVYVICFFDIKDGTLTLGGMFAFSTYMWHVIGPATVLTRLKYMLSEIKPCMRRHFEFLSVLEENYSTRIKVSSLSSLNHLIFDNVSLDYDEGIRALDSFTLEIKNGEIVVLTGKNGSGKSSMLNLLLRFYEPSFGKILVNDVDINMIDLNEYRSLFAVCPQNCKLFDGTVRENIDPKGRFSDEELMYKLNSWDISSFVEGLPQGLETIVGKDGSKLSVGQKQKVALIRAFLKPASILVLDEPDSSFDKDAKKILVKFLSSNHRYSFVIVVTHNYSSWEQIDKLILLEKGHLLNRIS